MKKINLKLLILIHVTVCSYSQTITKNAEGESTVLFRGNNIGLDIGETELSFGFNNLQNSLGEESKFIIGGSVKAKNNSGLGSLFSKGELVPEAELGGFAGWSFSNGLPSAYNKEANDIIEDYSEFIEDYSGQIKSKVKNLIISTFGDNYPVVKDDLVESNKNNDFPIFNNYLKTMISAEKDEGKKTILTTLMNNIDQDSLIKDFDSEKDKLEERISSLEQQLDKKDYYQLIIFGFGGINASEFKRNTQSESIVDLSNAFEDEKFRGGNIGIGLNFQYNNLIFGAKFSYLETNNFSLLTSKEFTLRSTTTIDDQTLIEEKKITAYSGSYGEVIVNELSADLIWNLKLDRKAENHILINPYLKSQINSRNSDLLPSSTNIGCGFYFFKQTGSFLGGLYVELPDVDNNFEKAKPIENQNLRDPLKRLSFGIVSKISIGSLLNSF